MYLNSHELPSDVYDLQHDDFYKLVSDRCGPVQADILKFQLISDAHIFIECEDPTEILKYNNEKLNELKNKSCLILDDRSSIVLPGIIVSFNSLRKRLLKKFDEDIKEMKKQKNTSNAATLLITSTPLTTSTPGQPKTTDELTSHINKLIEQWVDKYRVDLNLKDNCSLVNTVDYSIQFKHLIDGQQTTIITCLCGSKATLSHHTINGNIQVSE